MNPSSNSDPLQVGRRVERLSREIEENARRYAQNRTMPWLFVWAWAALIGAGVAAGIALVWSEISGGPFWMVALGAVLVLAGVALMFWSGSGGNRTVWNWGLRCYRSDGYVSLAAPWDGREETSDSQRDATPRPVRQFLTIVLWVLIFNSLLYGQDAIARHGMVTPRWTLAISALYIVPALIWNHFAYFGEKTPWLILSPVLYIVFAVLALLGIPVSLGDQPIFMIGCAVMIAVFAAGVFGHVYSRVALSKMKRASRMDPRSGKE